MPTADLNSLNRNTLLSDIQDYTIEDLRNFVAQNQIVPDPFVTKDRMTTGSYPDNSITEPKFATGAVSARALADGSVGTDAIQGNSRYIDCTLDADQAITTTTWTAVEWGSYVTEYSTGDLDDPENFDLISTGAFINSIRLPLVDRPVFYTATVTFAGSTSGTYRQVRASFYNSTDVAWYVDRKGMAITSATSSPISGYVAGIFFPTATTKYLKIEVVHNAASLDILTEHSTMQVSTFSAFII